MKTTELVFGKCLKLINGIELRRIDQQLFRQMPIENCCALSFGYIGHRVGSIDRVPILMSYFSQKTILTVPATILADQLQARAKPNFHVPVVKSRRFLLEFYYAVEVRVAVSVEG